MTSLSMSDELHCAVYALHTRHSAPLNHSVIVVSLADLLKIETTSDTRSSDDELPAGDTGFDKLFDLCIQRIQALIGESRSEGYVLIVLAAASPTRTGTGRNVGPRGRGEGEAQVQLPGAGWWLWNQGRVPRDLRKGMKRLYIIQPSGYTTTLLTLLLPLISPKTLPKLYPLSSLLSLYDLYGVSLAGLRASLPVLMHESTLITTSSSTRQTFNPRAAPSDPSLGPKELDSPAAGRTWADTAQSVLDTLAAYTPLSQLVYTPYGSLIGNKEETGRGAGGDRHRKVGRGYWNRTVEDMGHMLGPGGLEDGVVGDVGKGCNVMDELRRVIVQHCTGTEGIFRIAPNASLRPALVALLDLPLAHQPILDWDEIAKYDPTLPPKLYLKLFKSLSGPVVPHKVYPLVRQCGTVESIPIFLEALSPASLTLLHHLLITLSLLLPHTDTTRMSSLALAIVVAPDLINGPNLREDMGMCLPPRATSQGGSIGLPGIDGMGNGGSGGASLVEVLKMMLDHWEKVDGMFEQRIKG